MIIKTPYLDKAAFLASFGGKLVKIVGHYPDNVFVMRVNRWVALYEALGGWVSYRILCNNRRDIKRKARIHDGLPANFTGDGQSHFTFGDLAHVFYSPKEESLDKSHSSTT